MKNSEIEHAETEFRSSSDTIITNQYADGENRAVQDSAFLTNSELTMVISKVEAQFNDLLLLVASTVDVDGARTATSRAVEFYQAFSEGFRGKLQAANNHIRDLNKAVSDVSADALTFIHFLAFILPIGLFSLEYGLDRMSVWGFRIPARDVPILVLGLMLTKFSLMWVFAKVWEWAINAWKKASLLTILSFLTFGLLTFSSSGRVSILALDHTILPSLWFGLVSLVIVGLGATVLHNYWPTGRQVSNFFRLFQLSSDLSKAKKERDVLKKEDLFERTRMKDAKDREQELDRGYRRLRILAQNKLKEAILKYCEGFQDSYTGKEEYPTWFTDPAIPILKDPVAEAQSFTIKNTSHE
ncbi:MAG: hypothetical protein GC178_16725 [Flavobacteriales bacterium]|nr:hypothetical protein [Flavobacteriales bacterium]